MDTPLAAAADALASALDAELVTLALDGHEPAAREIVRRYERPVFNLLVRTVRVRADAEDLAQDTFLKLFRSLARFDRRLRLSAWVLKIAHNTAIDYLRRRRPELLPLDAPLDSAGATFSDVLPDAATPTPHEIAERGSLAQALDAALDRVRPEYRTVLVLRHQEGLDYGDIAEVTGWPLGTVKTFLHRGRQALAGELAAAGWTSPGRRSAETGGRTLP
jgi:RNA polymerase sigma-70 factor, ECF subfamily